MEQMRQILSQLALNLELNIAMCDKLEDHDKRIKALETAQKAIKTRIDALNTTVSQYNYALSNRLYELRKDDKG